MTSSRNSISWPAWRRLLLAWLALAVVMSANGVFREVVLRPRLGAAAGVVSALLGIALLLAVTRALFPDLTRLDGAALARVSVALVAATVAFETVLGLAVDGRSWRDLLGHYALWRGELWPLVLATLAATPFLWRRGAHPARD